MSIATPHFTGAAVDELIAVRRDLHRHPELCFQETRTADVIAKALTDWGITSRAAKQQRYTLRTWNPRDFTVDNYRTIDDRPYGGGPGMVMLPKPLEDAIEPTEMRNLFVGAASLDLAALTDPVDGALTIANPTPYDTTTCAALGSASSSIVHEA